jgi:hypothetical protein
VGKWESFCDSQGSGAAGFSTTQVQESSGAFCMAGFEVTLHGRIGVTPEDYMDVGRNFILCELAVDS